MATFGNYEIDGPTLATATTVFGPCPVPPPLCSTIIAPDGYYSDGVTVRRQVSGVLLSPENCPSCSGLCDGTISVAGGNIGQFLVSVDTGTGTGAVRIRWRVLDVPDALRVRWDGNIYNKMSSDVYGYLNDYSGVVSSLTEPILIGTTGAGTGCAPIPCVGCAQLSAIPVYEYLGGSWTNMGITTSLSIAASEVQTTIATPGDVILYVPKTAPGPSNVDVEMYGICSSTAFNIRVDCVGNLTGVDTSVVNATQVGACGLPITTTLYTGPVTGTPGVPGQHDWVFTNPESGVAGANTYAAAGFYKYNDGIDKWFEVSANGVIVNLGNC